VLHVVSLDVAHARLSAGRERLAFGFRRLRPFDSGSRASDHTFRDVFLDRLTGKPETRADGCLRIFGIHRHGHIAGQDHSLEDIKVNHRAARTGTKIGRFGDLRQFFAWNLGDERHLLDWFARRAALRATFQSLVGLAHKGFVHFTLSTRVPTQRCSQLRLAESPQNSCELIWSRSLNKLF
jgi:hypothetical protein